MRQLAILIVEDETEVREAVARDISEFASLARIEVAEDVPDARQAVNEILADDDYLALVLADHRLPGETGVDFLVSMQQDERIASAKTVLVTGQAGHEDTIRAVNEAGLDHYIAKPWQAETLQQVVRDQLTDYVLEMGLDPLGYLRILDQARAMEAWRRG